MIKRFFVKKQPLTAVLRHLSPVKKKSQEQEDADDVSAVEDVQPQVEAVSVPDEESAVESVEEVQPQVETVSVPDEEPAVESVEENPTKRKRGRKKAAQTNNE